MERFPRTATNIIAAVTGLAWLLTACRLFRSGSVRAWLYPAARDGDRCRLEAVPAVLTPLTATFVHSGLVHLGFNLLMLVWCGAAVERVIGANGIVLYIVGAYAAAAAQWAIDPAGRRR